MDPLELIEKLNKTTAFAYEHSAFYKRLYADPQLIRSLDDFQGLPLVTRNMLKSSDGIIDFFNPSKHQFLLELNPLNPDLREFPLTPLENEYDQDRRYRRVKRILEYIGAKSEGLIILCNAANIYFAADLERVVPWPLAILVCDRLSSAEVTDHLERLGARTVVLATINSISLNGTATAGRKWLTFNSIHQPANPEYLSCFYDVCTSDAIAWIAVRSGAETIYHSLDCSLRENGQLDRQFYLERDKGGNLIITTLCSDDEPSVLPFIRYDTGIRFTRVDDLGFGAVIRRGPD